MPSEPPVNGGYMIAAYVVVAAILLAYFLRLVRQVRGKR
jgi:hypothetical protein